MSNVSSAPAPVKKHISSFKPYLQPLSSIAKKPACKDSRFSIRVDALMRGDIPDSCIARSPLLNSPNIATHSRVYSMGDGLQQAMHIISPASDVRHTRSSVVMDTRGALSIYTEGNTELFPDSLKVTPPLLGAKKVGSPSHPLRTSPDGPM
ncbi:hypothetical protein JCM11251_004635 [Rhodosporidiobolus azoricus]